MISSVSDVKPPVPVPVSDRVCVPAVTAERRSSSLSPLMTMMKSHVLHKHS